MRRLLISVTIPLALLLMVFIYQPAAAQFGIAAGFNYESLSDIDLGDAKGTFDSASGYHVGIFYDRMFGSVGVKVGIFYRDLGDFEGEWEGVQEEIDHFDLTMIDFPVDIRFNLSATPVVQPYLLAGPVFSIPSSGSNTFDDSLESFLISGTIGGGIMMNIAGLKIFPEFRYMIGVSRLLEDQIEFLGTELHTDVERVNSVMLRLGIFL